MKIHHCTFVQSECSKIMVHGLDQADRDELRTVARLESVFTVSLGDAPQVRLDYPFEKLDQQDWRELYEALQPEHPTVVTTAELEVIESLAPPESIIGVIAKVTIQGWCYDVHYDKLDEWPYAIDSESFYAVRGWKTPLGFQVHAHLKDTSIGDRVKAKENLNGLFGWLGVYVPHSFSPVFKAQDDHCFFYG
ncbi:hypothetical protein TM7_0190 [candidate division TM7 genomosp. GTL1]|nr:hypothetical protein TM7_0190 [candidate division TM7 genomosp. GTL1]